MRKAIIALVAISMLMPLIPAAEPGIQDGPFLRSWQKLAPIQGIPSPSEYMAPRSVDRAVTVPPESVQSAIKNIVAGVSREYVLSYLTQLQGYGSRYLRSPGMYNCTQWLYECLLNDSRMTSEFQNFTYTNSSGVTHTVRSVVLTLPGLNTSSNRVYYLYNHVDCTLSFGSYTYDDLLYNNCPGADDDGSGVAATLEAARVLRRYDFQDTIRFAFFNGEEIGLYGAYYWAQKMVAAGENCQGGIDFDMIGYSPGNTQYDLDLEYNANSAWQAQHLLGVNSRYNIGLSMATAQVSGSIPSDITRFYQAGYPSIFAIEDTFSPVYHTKGDRVEVMNLTLPYKCTKLAVGALAEMARLMYVDVSPSNLTVSRTEPTEGDPVNVSVNVSNSGSLNATNLEVSFLADGFEYASKRIWVEANGTNTTNATWLPTTGPHNLMVVLDPSNEMVETDETNNTINITIGVNDRPRAVLSAVPMTALTNESIIFNGSLSTDIVGGITGYRFYFGDGNGTDWSSSPTASHAYVSDGVYQAILTVRDAHGALSGGTNLTVQVLNRAPMASPRSNVTRTLTFNPVKFTASATDPDGTVTTIWNFGDGSSGVTDQNPEHAYSDSGSYDVSLTVRDNDGASASFGLSILVDDRPPVCSIVTKGNTGDITTEFTLRAEASDPDGNISAYEWDLGDGTVEKTKSVTHEYARPGNYTVRLTVKDDDGTDCRALTFIIIRDRAPEAEGDVAPAETNTFKRVYFSGERSRDLEGVLTFAWDFGDGNTSTEMNAYHSYGKPGTYIPSLTVRDGAGQTDNVTLLPVVVYNRPPVARYRFFGCFTENGTIYFDGTNSTDPEGPVTCSWDFGDGKKSQYYVIDHVFPGPGKYEVRLTVTDDEGDTNVATQTIEVSVLPPPTTVVKPKPTPVPKDQSSTVNGLMALSLILMILVVVAVAWGLSRTPKKPHTAAPEQRVDAPIERYPVQSGLEKTAPSTAGPSPEPAKEHSPSSEPAPDTPPEGSVPPAPPAQAAASEPPAQNVESPSPEARKDELDDLLKALTK